MGYSTEFKGELKFTTELTASQLAEVKKFLSEDCRSHSEWEIYKIRRESDKSEWKLKDEVYTGNSAEPNRKATITKFVIGSDNQLWIEHTGGKMTLSYAIWSVKYQDMKLTVGDHIQVTDECRAHYRGPMKIEAMVVKGDNLLLKTKEFHTHGIGIANVKKVIRTQTPWSYVTEDGKTVYSGSLVYTYNSKSKLYSWSADKGEFITNLRETIIQGKEPDWKVFSSAKVREQWIEAQKPKTLLSTEDGVAITDKSQLVYGLTDAWTKFDQSAEGTKLLPNTCMRKGKWFSTEETREAYLIQHKPMFSIADIENAWIKCYGHGPSGTWFTETISAMTKEKLKAQ